MEKKDRYRLRHDIMENYNYLARLEDQINQREVEYKTARTDEERTFIEGKLNWLNDKEEETEKEIEEIREMITRYGEEE